MQIHGTSDGTVPYGGGAGWTEPIVSLVDYWADFNNCDLTAVVTNVPDINTGDGTTVEKFSYLNGDNCTEVIHYKVDNGGHTWPGTVFTSAGTNQDINASVEIWKFLSQYDINGLIGSCSTAGIENDFEDVYTVFPNPATNTIYIKGVQKFTDMQEVKITDLSGAIGISSNDIENGIDVSGLADGMYIVHLVQDKGETVLRFAKK